MKKKNTKNLTILVVVFMQISLFANTIETNSTNNIIELTVKGFVKEVIKRNPNMIFDRLQKDILKNKLIYEDNILIPKFYASLTHKDSVTPNNTEEYISRDKLSTYSEKQEVLQVGMTGLFSTGAKWNTVARSSQSQTSLIEQYNGYDTEYENLVEFSFTQPLLKGFGSDATFAKYNLTKADNKIFQKQYEKKVADLIGSALKTYWKFYGAKMMYYNHKESVNIHKNSIVLLEKKAKGGEIPYKEVIEAKSSLFIKEAILMKMENDIKNIKNSIFDLLNITTNKYKNLKFKLLDDSNDFYKNNISSNKYYKKALEYWPEYLIAKEKLNKEKINVKFTENQTKPQLDFVSSISSNTLDDERNRDYYDREFITWDIGIEFSMPLFDDQDNSIRNIALIKKRQALLELNTLEKKLKNAIDSKLSNLEISRKEINFYNDGLKLKQKILKMTQKEFVLGAKSIRNVLMYEDEILQYQRKYFNAVLQWKLAEAALDQVSGSLTYKYISEEELLKVTNKVSLGDISNLRFGVIE